jgi:hypothetical protein
VSKYDDYQPEWRISAKGNSYKKLGDGRIVTVFKTRGGGYKYVCDGHFSPGSYGSEEEAKEHAENNIE